MILLSIVTKEKGRGVVTNPIFTHGPKKIPRSFTSLSIKLTDTRKKVVLTVTLIIYVSFYIQCSNIEISYKVF